MTPEPRYTLENDDPCDGEMLTLCDSGRSEACSGVPTVEMAVPYLRESLRLCESCAAYEARQTEDAEPDPLRAPGVEGGVRFERARERSR